MLHCTYIYTVLQYFSWQAGINKMTVQPYIHAQYIQHLHSLYVRKIWTVIHYNNELRHMRVQYNMILPDLGTIHTLQCTVQVLCPDYTGSTMYSTLGGIILLYSTFYTLGIIGKLYYQGTQSYSSLHSVIQVCDLNCTISSSGKCTAKLYMNCTVPHSKYSQYI